MSSLAISNASPFATALPASHVFTAYDADGDAIMTDAATGLPITYGAPAPASGKRERSASLDSADSRPSKRSRSSSDETDYADMPPLIPASALAPPPAPQKAPRPPVASSDDQDGDGAESALRNLAEQMAEAVLQGEPRAAPAEPAPDAVPLPPAGDGPVEAEPEEWCMSVTVRDLALRLDMRHPRVVLNLLRFVVTYNELAPPGEEIHFPLMPEFAVDNLLSHESIVNPAPEFLDEINELRALVQRYSLPPPPEDEDEDDGYSSESSHRSWGRDSY